MIANVDVTATPICVGIDIALNEHRAAIISQSLLVKHRHFRKCPATRFANSEAGFGALLNFIRRHGSPQHCIILIESTGHYGQALTQRLHSEGISVYEIKPKKRLARQKTDKADAQSLANILYTQIALGAQPTDEDHQIRRLLPMSETAALLAGLVHRHRKLSRDCVAHRNRLTAIAVETFPEFMEVFKDANGPTALAIRRDFPRTEALSEATFADLRKYRKAGLPSDASLRRLPELAKTSIGTKNTGRVRGLALNQTQLIDELTMMQRHLEAIETEIAALIASSREGQILTSIPPCGPIQAAQVLVAIGRISNFETAAKLKGYAGWSPKSHQTGKTVDSSMLPKHGGKPMLRSAIYLVAWRAVQGDSEWAEIYKGLVARMCHYDERTKKHRRKNRALGRICGMITGLIWRLLKDDADTLSKLRDGEDVPPPRLYNRVLHHRHRMAHRA